MIVRHLEDTLADAVEAETWTSRRLLLAKHGMGFSVHDTVLKAGTTTRMHYQNHLEAVYCIEGSGRIRELDSGKVHEIRVGTLYALDQHDRHELVADTQLRMVCVFNPPVVGPETHDASGAYPLMTLDDV